MRRKAFLVAVMLVSAAMAWNASAADKKGKAKRVKKVKMTPEVKGAMELLESKDVEVKMEGINKLAELADPSGVAPLVELLEKGQKDKVTHAVIDALGAISSPKAIPVLIEYMRHRRPAVRIRAVNAIAEIKSKQVSEALKNALKDSDSTVRKTAALALGRYGDSSAVDILFKAFDRNVVEAAIAIGQLGNVDDMERLSSYLKKSPLTLLLPGFLEFLGRGDFPEKGKVKIIEKLKELAGPEVKQFLIRFVAGLPEDYEGPVRKKAEEAINSIAD
jgi:hypothetical protein